MVKNSITGFAAMVVSFAACLQAADGKLEVKFFDVGQADAILVTCPDGNHHLLIDAADTRYPESADHFRSFLRAALMNQPACIDVLVASHPHSDHIGSMQWVLTSFQVGTYVENGDTSETATFGNLRRARQKLSSDGRLTYINAKQESFSPVDFCAAVETEIFEPWAHGRLSGKNDRSLAVRLKYGERTFLFVGDCEAAAEKIMLNGFTGAQRERLKADVLKVGHHASDTSSTDAFISAVSPEVAVVSVGRKDVSTNVKCKHPRLSTVRKYATWFRNHAPVVNAGTNAIQAYDADQRAWRSQTRPAGLWLTVRDGTVTVRTDGQTLTVEKSAP